MHETGLVGHPGDSFSGEWVKLTRPANSAYSPPARKASGRWYCAVRGADCLEFRGQKRKTVEVPFEHGIESQRDSLKDAEDRRRLSSQLPVRICV